MPTGLPPEFPANRVIYRDILQNLALHGDFRVQSASKFSRLQPNSVRNGTANFWRHNKEFFSKSRQFKQPEQRIRPRTNILTRRDRRMAFGLCRLVEPRTPFITRIIAHHAVSCANAPNSTRQMLCGILLKFSRNKQRSNNQGICCMTGAQDLQDWSGLPFILVPLSDKHWQEVVRFSELPPQARPFIARAIAMYRAFE